MRSRTKGYAAYWLRHRLRISTFPVLKSSVVVFLDKFCDNIFIEGPLHTILPFYLIIKPHKTKETRNLKKKTMNEAIKTNKRESWLSSNIHVKSHIKFWSLLHKTGQKYQHLFSAKFCIIKLKNERCNMLRFNGLAKEVNRRLNNKLNNWTD